LICREFSTDVEVPYRYVNNWILDVYEWLNGSLVKLVNMVKMGK